MYRWALHHQKCQGGGIPAAPLQLSVPGLAWDHSKLPHVQGFPRSGWDLGGGVSRGAPFPARVGSAEGRPQGLLAGGDGGCTPAAVPQFPPLGKRCQQAATLWGTSSWPDGLGGGGSGAPLGMGGRGGLFLLGSTVRVVGRGLRVRGPVGTLNDQAGLIPGPGGPPQSLRSRATATGGIRDRAVRDPRGRAP